MTGVQTCALPISGLRLLQERKELLATFDRWTTLSSEVEAKAGDIDRYEQSVRDKAVLSGLAVGETESQEAGLWKALSQARNAQTKHDQLTSQITETEKILTTAIQTEQMAVEAMNELMRLSDVDTSEELEPLLANLEKRASIQHRINSFRETLSGLARGQGLTEFITRVQAENAEIGRAHV